MLTQLPVLSLIPKIVTQEERVRERRKRIAVAASAIGAITVSVIAFHFLVMDLHVFYAKLMRFIETRLLI